jgi:mRNA-degrading endonuclease RelE of RelBE toxin-antitoxin system
MTNLQLHEKIEKQLSQIPSEKLTLISDFLDSIQDEKTIGKSALQRISPIKRGKTAKDLLRYAGNWQGDDLEDCLRLVKETRSQTEF